MSFFKNRFQPNEMLMRVSQKHRTGGAWLPSDVRKVFGLGIDMTRDVSSSQTIRLSDKVQRFYYSPPTCPPSQNGYPMCSPGGFLFVHRPCRQSVVRVPPGSIGSNYARQHACTTHATANSCQGRPILQCWGPTWEDHDHLYEETRGIPVLSPLENFLSHTVD